MGWKVHRLTMIQWSNLTKTLFIFQHSLPCGSHTSSIGIAVLWFLWYRSSYPNLRKSPQLQIWPHHRSDSTVSQPRVFHIGEQKIVRWCQVRRIWRVINQFKATVLHSSHCNHRLMCRSIVLVKQDSLHQFSRPFWKVSSTTFQSVRRFTYLVWVYLEGNNAVSIRKGWI